MLPALSAHLHHEVFKIAVLKRQSQKLTDSEPAVQNQQCSCVGAGLIDALRFEYCQPPDLLRGKSSEDLLLLLRFRNPQVGPRFRNALMQRSREFTEVGDVPLVRNSTIQRLIALSDPARHRIF